VNAFILLDGEGRKHLVPSAEGPAKVDGLGVIDTSKLEEHVGGVARIAGKAFIVLRPSLRDRLETLNRKAQIVGAKDAASILLNCDLNAGDIVVEGGAGSGALSMVLAQIVSPGGKVITYEIREDFAAVSRGNMERAAAFGNVEVKIADIRQGISERDVDAVVLDIPDPWEAVAHAWTALRPCGHFASFSPNMEQVKETCAALGRQPWVEVRTLELIERQLEVRPEGVRPSFAPLGHTGYLTFARKVLERL